MRNGNGKRPRVLVLMTTPYPEDSRPRREIRTLLEAGFQVNVVCATSAGRPARESLSGLEIRRFRNPVVRAHEARMLASGDDEGGRSSDRGLRERGVVLYALDWGLSTGAALVVSLRLLWRPGFDVVHVHNPPDTLAPAAAVFKPLGKRLVYDHHDLVPEMLEARGGRPRGILYRLLRLLERGSCRIADHVIATNDSYRAVDIERNRVSSERITVVRNGPDLREIQGVSPDLELRARARFLVGYFGVMGLQDGVEYLVRAHRRLVHELGRSDVLCVIVGAGDAWDSARALARELELEEHVHFTGWLSRREGIRIVASLDVGVEPAPSNAYNDRSTMVKVMEYMALGKPVVGFDLPENRVTAGGAGLFVRPNDADALADAIAELLDDRERRDRMGRIGRMRVERELAWDHSAAGLLSVYDRLFDADLDANVAL